MGSDANKVKNKKFLGGAPPKNREIQKNRFSNFFFFLEAPPYKSLKTKEKKKFFFSYIWQKNVKKFFGPYLMNIARKK